MLLVEHLMVEDVLEKLRVLCEVWMERLAQCDRVSSKIIRAQLAVGFLAPSQIRRIHRAEEETVIETVEEPPEERIRLGLWNSDMDAAQEMVVKIYIDCGPWRDRTVFRISREDLEHELLSDAHLYLLADAAPVLAQVERDGLAGLADVAIVPVEAAGIADMTDERALSSREEGLK